jgi:tetratricopeptide (TPR) repeat protein
MKSILLLFMIAASASARAGVDTRVLQEQISKGQPDHAREALTRALNSDPKNPYLLYDRAIASYAAGKFDEALVDLDFVQDSTHRDLAHKAQFQKGNAQYKMGLANLQRDREVTLSRWRQSVSEYADLLKKQPNHTEARQNHDFVRRQLRALLMQTATNNLQTAESPRPPEEQINSARAAMEEFHEAAQMEPADQAASQGEQRARDLLADALTREGERKTMANNMVMPARNEPAIIRPDTHQIEEGVNMLEDAHSLKPEDPNIAQKLEAGRDRLADALTQQAQMYAALEPRIPRIDEKLGLLRMSMELLEKALSERPNHPRAKQAMEEVKRRLAEIHEQEGDRLNDLAENANLEQQAQALSQALDHFQQASDLQPQQNQLPQKAQNTQARLEDALEKLGDRLMKSPGLETLDQQVMRMEGASQAFNELESLKPSPQISEKARQAASQLEKLRQMLAERGQQPQPGQQQAFAPTPPQNQPEGMPMDAPPKLDTKGRNGRYQSPAMNRNLRDY